MTPDIGGVEAGGTRVNVKVQELVQRERPGSKVEEAGGDAGEIRVVQGEIEERGSENGRGQSGEKGEGIGGTERAKKRVIGLADKVEVWEELVGEGEEDELSMKNGKMMGLLFSCSFQTKY